MLTQEEAVKEQLGIKNAVWFKGHYVIGYDSALGDPYMVDLSSSELTVYKYSIGSKQEPRMVNSSASGFFKTLSIYKELSVGREHPVACRKNKLGFIKKLKFIRQIKKIDSSASKSHWWLMLHG